MKYLYKSRLDLADLYIESRDLIIISEMNEKVIEYLNDNSDELPFDHIFGNKMRVVIPLEGSKTGAELIRDLRTLKDFSRFSPITHDVIKKIKLNPKYATKELEKEQVVSIGKAINSLKISPEKKKTYLNWYAKYKDYLERTNLNEMSEYSIVLSRAPIDVVRMSDHRNISSCHSNGGSYFECAVQEALTGGGIAYLVHTDSLKGLSEEELQNSELFGDSERNVRGIEPPVARLRIRRVQAGNENVGELAVPEDSIYGKQDVPEFYETVKDYIKSKQPLTQQELKSFTEEGGINFKGGSYVDTDINSLIKMYYDTPEVNYTMDGEGIIKSDPDDYKSERHIKNFVDLDDVDPADVLDEEFSAVKAQYGYNNVSVWYDVDENDGNAYASYGGSTSFDMTPYAYDPDHESDTEDLYYDSKRHHDPLFRAFLLDILKDDFESLFIERLTWEDGSLSLGFRISEEDSIIYDSNEFNWFCRNLQDLDKKYDEYYDKVLELLQKNGLVTDSTFEKGDRVEQISTGLPFHVMNSTGSECRIAPYPDAPMTTWKWVNVNDLKPLEESVIPTFEQFFSSKHQL